MTLRLAKTLLALDDAERVLLTTMQGGFRSSGTSSVMNRLMGLSPALAETISDEFVTFHALALFRLEGSVPPGLVEKALHRNDAVRALLPALVTDERLLNRAEEIFFSRAVAIRRGTQLVDAVSEELVAQAPRLRKLARARRANAPPPELVRQVEDSVIDALGRIKLIVRKSAPHEQAVLSFLHEISITEGLGQQRIAEALAELVDRLARSQGARRKWLSWVEPPDLDTFVKSFGPERNFIKGILGEIWFEQATETAKIREMLFHRAIAFERKMNTRHRMFTADFHVGPLYDPGGRQIFDGMYFIGRPAQQTDAVKEIHLSAVIEVKTGTRRSNAYQLRGDQVRELGTLDEGLVVRTTSGQRYRIMPSPDAEDPLRVFVAPEAPPRSVTRSLEAGGVTLVHVPTLPTSQDFSRVADFFLLAMLSRY